MVTKPGKSRQKPVQEPPDWLAPADNEGRNAYTNRVISVTERRVLLDVRAKFSTLPALDFADWLTEEIKRVC